MAALPVRFEVEELDKSYAAGVKIRSQCLDRLKLRSPALSPMHGAIWPAVVRHWCIKANFRGANKLAPEAWVGGLFLRQVNDTLRKLGKHYGGPTMFTLPALKKVKIRTAAAEPDDPLAFQKLFERMLETYMNRKGKGKAFAEL